MHPYARNLTPPPSSTGTWLLVEATTRTRDPHGRIVERSRLAYAPQNLETLPLHPLERHDPRVASLALGRRVSTPAPSFRICQPQRTRGRIVGAVAVSLVGGSIDMSGMPSLWIDGEPLGLLYRSTDSIYDWVRRASAGTPTWMTIDGTSLWSASLRRAPSGCLAITLDEVR